MEIELEDRVIVISRQSVLRVQALWRGAIVRSHLKQLKKDYEKIFLEIEDKKETNLVWQNGLLGVPRSLSKAKIVAKTKAASASSQVITTVTDTKCDESKPIEQIPIKQLPDKDTQNPGFQCDAKENTLDLCENLKEGALNQSLVWGSVNSTDLSAELEHYKSIDREELQNLRANVFMELLWVQQAITSRKQYLGLKSNIRE